jgi:hypothetical protein
MEDKLKSLFDARRRATVKDFSRHFGKSEETIRRWCRRESEFLAPLGLRAEKDPGGRDWLIVPRKTK